MGFYGNIAVKVIYINIVEDTFKGPRLMSSKGRFVWMGRWPFQLFQLLLKQCAIRASDYILDDRFVLKLSYFYSRLKSDFPAFTICSAVPQIQTIGGFISAVSVMQFTFTFPPLLLLGYQVMTDAMTEDKAFSPGNGSKGRIDTWKEWSRWKRVKTSL